MQFVIIARDHQDAEALSRRLNEREAHIELSNQAIKNGEQLYGVAILNNEDKMCGSVMIVNFSTELELKNWLSKEPYITGKVWDNIEILPCKVGPSFEVR